MISNNFISDNLMKYNESKRQNIRSIQIFPKKGILFRDFSPILKDPSALSFIADEFSKYFHPNDIDVFAGIESRGFILASVLASRYNKGYDND